MNVNGCNYFLVEESSDTPLLLKHVACHFVRLLSAAICCTAKKKKRNINRKVQSLVPHRQYPHLILWANIIGDITFRTALIHKEIKHLKSCCFSGRLAEIKLIL